MQRYAQKPITPNELLKYFGICVLMDLVVINGPYSLYWSREWGINQVRASGMQRGRWQLIRLCLRGYSVKRRRKQFHQGIELNADYFQATTIHLESAFNQIMPCHWAPSEFLAMDENMTRCHSSFCPYKQRMPQKPIKEGLKMFCISETRCPYTLKVCLYTGQRLWSRLSQTPGYSGHTTNSALLLHHMAQQFMQPAGATRERIVVVDNAFTSANTLLSLSSIVPAVRVLGTCTGVCIPKGVKAAIADLRPRETHSRSTPALGFGILQHADFPGSN